MRANNYFLTVFCLCEFANFLHWGGERGQSFLYTPQAGWPWIVSLLLVASIFGGLLLYPLGVIPDPIAAWPMLAFCTWNAVYSIVHRHGIRKQAFTR